MIICNINYKTTKIVNNLLVLERHLVTNAEHGDMQYGRLVIIVNVQHWQCNLANALANAI